MRCRTWWALAKPDETAYPFRMTDLYLLRDGETEWNAAGRFQGQRNSPLTARGREQAAQIGSVLFQALRNPSRSMLHVHPLGRTRETATIVCQYVSDLDPWRIEPRLREVSTGVWDGLTQEEIDDGWPGARDGTDHYDWYFRSPDGETLEAALRRVRQWVEELDGPMVAVSHVLLGRLIRGVWLGLPTQEMLRLPVPQDVVWHLSPDGITALA